MNCAMILEVVLHLSLEIVQLNFKIAVTGLFLIS